jgi:hypothetical protein
VPKEVRFTTHTLRYPDCAWLQIDGLETHWERADVRGVLDDQGHPAIETRNVAALTVRLPGPTSVTIDGQTFTVAEGATPPASPTFHKEDGKWKAGPILGRRKYAGLTGPIDDAFMGSFLFVRPTGKPLNDKVGQWAAGELAHASKMWRDIFRGDAPVKDDSAVTDADIADSNLILWGDPSSNALLAKILPKLPLKWDGQTLEFRGYALDASHHAPILIFPNPLNPRRYVVLNSGIDFREEAYGSNSLQTPKLPDWAIVDLDTPPGPRWPGLIHDAGFFDEEWR